MKGCKRALQYICDNLDAEVHSRKCMEIKRHLEQCPDCTAYLASLQKTIVLYKRYPCPSVSKRAHNKLLRALRDEKYVSGDSVSKKRSN